MTEETSLRKLDFNMSKHFTLSIRLSSDCFAFSIFNPLNEEPLTYIIRNVDKDISLPANLKQLFRNNSFLNHPFFKVNVIIDTKRYTMVPFEIFDDDAVDDIFNFNVPKGEETEEIIYNILPKANTVVLFGMDKLIEQLFNDEYSNIRFFAHISPLAEYFTVKSSEGNSKKIYVFIKTDAIDVFCLDHGNLLLVNTYICKATADICYYILCVWKQLGYDQEHDELHLAGNIPDKEKLLSKLNNFIKNVYFVSSESKLGVTDDVKVPFDLQTLNLCEL